MQLLGTEHPPGGGGVTHWPDWHESPELHCVQTLPLLPQVKVLLLAVLAGMHVAPEKQPVQVGVLWH